METCGPRATAAGGPWHGGGVRGGWIEERAYRPRAVVRTLVASLAGRGLSRWDLLFEHTQLPAGSVVGEGVPGHSGSQVSCGGPWGLCGAWPPSRDGPLRVCAGRQHPWLLRPAPPSATSTCGGGPACCCFVGPGLGPEAAAPRLSRAGAGEVSCGKGGVLGRRGWAPKWGAHLCILCTPREFALAHSKRNWKPKRCVVWVRLPAPICSDSPRFQAAGPASNSAETRGRRSSALASWATSCCPTVSPVKVTVAVLPPPRDGAPPHWEPLPLLGIWAGPTVCTSGPRSSVKNSSPGVHSARRPATALLWEHTNTAVGRAAGSGV